MQILYKRSLVVHAQNAGAALVTVPALESVTMNTDCKYVIHISMLHMYVYHNTVLLSNEGLP